jgi:hypothetical protein
MRALYTEAEGRYLVYGMLEMTEPELIFVPVAQAKRLRYLRYAMDKANTWGELFTMLPPELVDYVTDAFYDELPEDDEPFNPHDVPGYSEGDWPVWLQQGMLSCLPGDVQDRFGEELTSVHNGNLLFNLNSEFGSTVELSHTPCWIGRTAKQFLN